MLMTAFGGSVFSTDFPISLMDMCHYFAGARGALQLR